MCRKITPISGVLLILVALLSIPAPMQGQTLPTMRYAFTFQDEIEGATQYSVAVLDSENAWTVTPLIQFSRLATDAPVWSPDGRQLLGVQAEYIQTADADAARMRGRSIITFEYPDWNLTNTFEVLPALLEDTKQAYEQADILQIQSVSPDGRYAWLVQTVQINRATLLNLETGELVAQPECAAIAVGWLPDRVIAMKTPQSFDGQGNPTDCLPEIFTVDLATGATITLQPQLPNTVSLATDAPQMIYAPQWNAVIVSDTMPSQIGMLNLDGTGGFFLPTMSWPPTLSPNERYLTYEVAELNGNRLVRLDLQTGIPESLDTGVRLVYWEGNTLYYTKEALTVTEEWHFFAVKIYANGERMERRISHYPSQIVSEGVRQVNNTVYVARNGVVVWSSDNALPDANLHLYRPLLPKEPIFGRFVWLAEHDANDPQGIYSPYKAHILDLKTLQVITAPRGWQVSGIAPDGEWVLCVSLGNVGLMAYHPASGEMVMLSETARTPGAFSPLQYQWTPQLALE